MRFALRILAFVLVVSGCASQQPNADPATIAAVSYRDTSEASITVITMISNATGAGGHSALLINASERILFDPAGSFYSEIVPERDDVLFGISPRVEQYYKSSHARSTHHVVTQKITVTPEQAQLAYQVALQNGPVMSAFCTQATSGVLRQIPGFEQISATFFPDNLMRQVAEIPGVETDRYYEGDDPDLQKALAQGIDA
ncbi:MAG: hypothetical protein AAGA05_11785 [Pseudomonadota bacterium]